MRTLDASATSKLMLTMQTGTIRWLSTIGFIVTTLDGCCPWTWKKRYDHRGCLGPFETEDLKLGARKLMHQ